LAIAVWAVVASQVWAQPEGRGRGRGGAGFGFDLVGIALQKPVSEELKLSDDQITRLKELGEPERRGEGGSREERQKKRMEAAQAREKKVAEILEPAQLKRLKEIGLQSLGVRAFSIPRLVADLNLTEDQQDKIRKITEESAFDLGKMMRSGELAEGDSDEIKAANKAKIAKVNDAAMEKVVALLTSEQQAKWKELLGEPFKGQLEQRGGFGGRRRGND
jgi:hypothetical protein